MERFALRWWDKDANGRLTLNGDVIKLHGWNHHTQWPDTGAAPTDAQLDADLALLLKAGTNYVRGAHYPQDQRWLDRLDEAGSRCGRRRSVRAQLKAAVSSTSAVHQAIRADGEAPARRNSSSTTRSSSLQGPASPPRTSTIRRG